MNERLENILIDTLENTKKVGGDIYGATKDGITKAVDFAQEEIPLIIKEILAWEFAYHTIWAALGLSLFIGLIVTAVYFLRRGRKSDSCDDEGWYIASVISAILAIITFLAMVPHHALTATKILVAPKVFFIDYCSDLISAHRKETITHQNGSVSIYKRKHGH